LFEVIIMTGILIIIFPILNRNIRDRADSIRNELVLKDMTRIKSAVENFMERQADSLDFSENPMLEFSGMSLAIFECCGLPRNFRAKSVLNQEYMVKIRKIDDSLAGNEYDAIVIALGNPDIPDVRLRQIARASRGTAGYVEGDNIYGTSWQIPRLAWTAGTPLSRETLVVRTNFIKRKYQYISRVKADQAKMNTDLYMGRHGINSVRQLGITHPDGEAEVTDLKLIDLKDDTVPEISTQGHISKMSINDKITLGGNLYATQGTVIALGLLRPSTAIAGGTILSNIYVEKLLNVSGDITTLSLTEASAFRLAQAQRLGPLGGGRLAITIGGGLFIDENVIANIGSITADALHIDASSADGCGGISNINGCGLLFSKILSKNNLYYIGTDAANPTATNFHGYDVIVHNVNSQLVGGANRKKIGGIDITLRTPLSVILRAIQYEYATLYNSITNEWPDGSLRPVAAWSVRPANRCLAEKCSGVNWDGGQ
jgi:hypothetical protein